MFLPGITIKIKLPHVGCLVTYICIQSNKSLFFFKGVNITFQYFGKTTTRLPEALFFEFSPSYPKQATPAWRLSKLGNLVDPNNVMLNGSQQQHGQSTHRDH